MKEEERVYKVYMHINLLNGKKYIGLTKQEPEQRWRNGNGYKNNIGFWNAIQKYGWHNFKHIVLFDRLTKSEAEEIEIELIKYNKSNNKKYGYNIEKGGSSQKYVSNSTKNKIKKIRIGSHLSEETKQKISLAHKGKKAWNSGLKNCFSKETLDKMRKSQKEYAKKHKSENFYARNLTEVICLETKEKFNSLTDCAKKFNTYTTLIWACCNKKQKSTRGFHFMYLEDYLKKEVDND